MPDNVKCPISLSTVARVAGNIAAAMISDPVAGNEHPDTIANLAVDLALRITNRVMRVQFQPAEAKPKAEPLAFDDNGL